VKVGNHTGTRDQEELGKKDAWETERRLPGPDQGRGPSAEDEEDVGGPKVRFFSKGRARKKS